MKIKILIQIAISIIIALPMINCNSNEPKEIDFCKMLKRDKSHVNRDTSDIDKYYADKQLRRSLIKENFRELVEYSNIYGLPEMGSLKATGLDSCRNWAVSITIFHIGQIDPILFFDEDAVDLFKREIENGNFKNKNLQYALREGFKNHELCEDRKGDILKALKLWKLNIEDLPKIKFKNC